MLNFKFYLTSVFLLLLFVCNKSDIKASTHNSPQNIEKAWVCMAAGTVNGRSCRHLGAGLKNLDARKNATNLCEGHGHFDCEIKECQER